MQPQWSLSRRALGRHHRFLVGVPLLVLLFVLAVSTARAAGSIIVAVSPSVARQGQPMEVLVRTFLPFRRDDVNLAVPSSRDPLPVPSGYWAVLYPWPDYPFDVVAISGEGSEVRATLSRDPNDATLWRGRITLGEAGTWTIWVRNYERGVPGATSTVRVLAAQSPSPSAAPARPGAPASSNLDYRVLMAAVVVFVGGFLAGMLPRARVRAGRR